MRRLYALSFAASLIQALGIPTLPLYGYSLGLKEAEIGFVAGLSSATYVVATLASIPLSARLDEGKVILLSLILLGLGYSLHPLAGDAGTLLAAASVVAISYGLLWPSVESVVSAKGGEVSMFSFSWSSGTVIGSALLSPLTIIGVKNLYFLYAASSLCLLSLAASLSKDSTTVQREELGEMKGIAKAWVAWILCIAYSASSGGMLTFYPLLVEERNLSKALISASLSTMMIARCLAFYAYRRFPSALKSPLSGAILVLTPVLIPFSNHWMLHILAACLSGLGQSVVYAAALKLVFDIGGSTKFTAAFEAFIGVGYSLGPLVGGVASSGGIEPLPVAAFLAAMLSATARFKRFSSS